MSMNWREYNEQVLNPMAEKLRTWVLDEDKRVIVMNCHKLAQEDFKLYDTLYGQIKQKITDAVAKKKRDLDVCKRCDGEGHYYDTSGIDFGYSDSLYPTKVRCRHCSMDQRAEWRQEWEKAAPRLREREEELYELCERLSELSELRQPERGDVVVLQANPRARKAYLKEDHVGCVFYSEPGQYGQRYGLNTQDFNKKTDSPVWVTGWKYMFPVSPEMFDFIERKVTELEQKRLEESRVIQNFGQQMELSLYR